MFESTKASTDVRKQTGDRQASGKIKLQQSSIGKTVSRLRRYKTARHWYRQQQADALVLRGRQADHAEQARLQDCGKHRG
jgi:hypothetical protein